MEYRLTSALRSRALRRRRRNGYTSKEQGPSVTCSCALMIARSKRMPHNQLTDMRSLPQFLFIRRLPQAFAQKRAVASLKETGVAKTYRASKPKGSVQLK